jgi:hypothetical protein
MERLILILLFATILSPWNLLTAQIEQSEVTRIISTLAADDMMGRQAFTPYADKAAAFIAQEYKRAGLKKWKKTKNYLQTFPVYEFTIANLNISADGKTMEDAFASTTERGVDWNQDSGVKNVQVGENDNFRQAFGQYRDANEKTVVWVHSAH